MDKPKSAMKNRLKQTAGDWITFIKAPSLDTQPPYGSRITDVAWLFLLNCLIVAAIAVVLFPAMVLLDIEMSSDMSALFQRPIWQILAIVVIVGPIMEELAFRSWISGNPRLLVLLGGVIAWVVCSYGLTQMGFSTSDPILAIALGAGIVIATIVGFAIFWKKPVPHWYVKIFPGLFWMQALIFGFIHVFNYAGDNPAALLPFVLPQLVGGLIWGYARIRYGWWSNILMHMGYNFIATSGLLFMLISGEGMPGSQ